MLRWNESGSGACRLVETVLRQNRSGSGTVNGALVNGSTVSPGNSPGVLTVDGDCTQGSTATLAIELTGSGGVAGTDYDRVLVWVAANLDGTLDLQVDAGYTPTIGDSMPGSLLLLLMGMMALLVPVRRN